MESGLLLYICIRSAKNNAIKGAIGSCNEEYDTEGEKEKKKRNTCTVKEMRASGVLKEKMFLEIPPMHAITSVGWSRAKENTADLKSQ